jgi:membrane associated rhomboid family serine protease
MTQFRPGGFQILPMVVKNLLIINVLVYLAQSTLKLPFIEDTFALHTWQSPLFKPWQFITYMFLHHDWWHVLGNMFALWMFGSTLENLWGPQRFLIFFISCGLGAALCHMGVLYFENQSIINAYQSMDPAMQQEYQDQLLYHLNGNTTGASGAVYGCLAAFGYLFPNDYIYLNFLFPVKVKWFVTFYILSELVSQFHTSAGDNVAHMAHLGGALVGFLMVYYWKKNNHRSIY